MNRKSLRVIASAVLLGVSVFGSVAVAAPANRASLDALVTRIKGDNELTRLYATHFNASVEKVADYINDLKPIALEKATLFNVFALRGGDSRIERYEIGSIVFADKNERPIMDAFGNPLVKLILLGLLWAYLHHFCAGIRFLFLDLHKGIDLKSAVLSSKIVFGVSIALTLIVGVKVLW